MSDWNIGNPWLAWLIPVILLGLPILLMLDAWNRRRMLARFATQNLHASLLPPSKPWQKTFAVLLVLSSATLLALAAMDVRWGKAQQKVPQKGIEVVFALDVSRSMLAQDTAPNRLTRAKQQIKDMVDEMAGDRVGLVVFAGEAKQAIPMTSHYGDFKLVLDSVGPESVLLGGSNLGSAIRVASDCFIEKTNDHRTIVMLTDGEDQESQPVELARKLHQENGTRVFTVGLGDLVKGSRIPDASENRVFVEYEGQQVWSRQNGAVLQEIADQTGAAYLPVGTKRVEMGEVYHRLIATVEETEFESAKLNLYIPRFQWFALPALVLLCLEILISSRGAKSSHRQGQRIDVVKPTVSSTGLSPSASMVLLMALVTPWQQRDLESDGIRTAIEQLQQEDWQAAIETLERVEGGNDEAELSDYHLGIAKYRLQQYAEAGARFASAAKSSDRVLASKARFNRGNCHYALAVKKLNGTGESKAIDEIRQDLSQAIMHYRSALRLDSEMMVARQNLERATRLLRSLQERQDPPQQDQPQQQSPQGEQQNQPPQSDPDGQAGESSSDQNQDPRNPGDSEEPEDSQSQAPASNRSQESQSPQKTNESRKQESGEPSSDKNEPSEQSQSAEPSQEPSNDSRQTSPEPGMPDGESESGDAGQDPINPQPDPSEPADQDKEKQAPTPNPSVESADTSRPPGDLPSDAGQESTNQDESVPEGKLGALNQDQPTDPPDKQAGQRAIIEEDGPMTRQEALKLLQAVRDRDMLRRLRQKQRQRQRRRPVERDW